MNERRGLIFVVVVALGLGLYVYIRQNANPPYIEQAKTVDQVAPAVAPQAPVTPVAATSNEATESKDTVAAPTANTAAAPMTPAREKFRQLIADVKKQIPKRAALQKLSAEEAHFAPASVQQAALGMGQIAQAIADDPSLAADGENFYRDCAKDETNPNSIRASCLSEHESLKQKAGLKDEKSLSDDPAVSERIKKLAGSLNTK